LLLLHPANLPVILKRENIDTENVVLAVG